MACYPAYGEEKAWRVYCMDLSLVLQIHHGPLAIDSYEPMALA